jgi:tRNA(Ile)-lysidine synthase
MANSRKSRRSSGSGPVAHLAVRVAASLDGVIRPSSRLVLGLSGGVDSVVLLDCLRRVARRLNFRLSALHVNHRLSPNAGRWSAFCRRVCRERGVPFRAVTVRVRQTGGPEAAARAARYAVFADQACDYVMLAHHRDDQVETFLLQLLRGAGVKGLAVMPALRKSDGDRQKAGPLPITRHPSPGILRPLLDVTRDEILQYARNRRLKWVEDESNADAYFLRNYLRHEVLPLIARRFPAYCASIARSARHIAEADEILDEVAAADGEGYLLDGTLAVAGLRRLSDARARNLLRRFIAAHGIAMPSTDRLREALRQLLTAKRDAGVAVELEGAGLRRFDGRVHLVRALKAPVDLARRWRGEDRLELPELGGALVMDRTTGSGISQLQLRGKPVMVRIRMGGERLQPNCSRPRRSLKKLLQEAKLPPWQRERLPLIFHGEALVWAPGIGVDCAFQARRGQPGLLPCWVPA